MINCRVKKEVEILYQLLLEYNKETFENLPKNWIRSMKNGSMSIKKITLWNRRKKVAITRGRKNANIHEVLIYLELFSSFSISFFKSIGNIDKTLVFLFRIDNIMNWCLQKIFLEKNPTSLSIIWTANCNFWNSDPYRSVLFHINFHLPVNWLVFCI